MSWRWRWPSSASSRGDIRTTPRSWTGWFRPSTAFTSTSWHARPPAEMVIEFTEYDRPHRLASRTAMRGAEVRGSLNFEPLGDRTRLHWDCDVRPNHVRWLLAPVVRAVGSRQERICWSGLKRHPERHPPSITARSPSGQSDGGDSCSS
ncbi:MAG: SRPBCC family protein [Nocardioides sp.]|nr:SRPBCC family protein [Nocardioides sp.]